MISANLVILIAVGYVVLLFALAYFSERWAEGDRGHFLRSPLVYTLAISVYCTSWTFYGAVGSAARSGLEFFAIYLGPTLVFVGWWFGLRKLVRIGRNQRITSVADLISSRFGKSNRLAVLVTLIAVIGTTPYIALQLKAITTSLSVISSDSILAGVGDRTDDNRLALGVAAGMALFTILFGTRNVDAKEQHHGVVAAIAFEAIVKLVALMAVGIFVVFGIGGGFSEIFSRAESVGVNVYDNGGFGTRWVTILVLSAAAIICLPRQFQITVVENSDENHLRTASWLFPLYLLGMSVFTLPIAIVGLNLLPAGTDPDMFVLTLPLAHDQELLALFAFIGGFSSATSMIIIASIALSIMVSNHIVMPIALRTPWIADSGDGQGVTNLLLNSRRVSICAVLALGFLYFWLTNGSGALARIGLISFSGVAQFLPSIIAALYWRDATSKGAGVGLFVGFAVWAYTLFLPSFVETGGIVAQWVENGPYGISFLRPEALFGLEGIDPLVHSVFWSLLANAGLLVLVSLSTSQSALERIQSTLFVDAFRRLPGTETRFMRSSAAANDLFFVAQRVLGAERATAIFDDYLKREVGSRAQFEPTPDFIAHLEKELAGSIGAASAHVMLSQVVSGDNISLQEVMQIADETQQVIEYSQQLEQKSEELKQTAEKLQDANEKLRELDQEKDDFLSQVSHEVRTPMTSIRSFSEILLDPEGVTSEQRARFLSTIHTESLRLTLLLDEILDLSALERGEKTWVNEPVDVTKVLQRAALVCDPLAKSSGIKMRSLAIADAPFADANGDRLCQVFINLISNAIKYNDSQNPYVELSMKRVGKRLQIEFQDNGPGIALKDRKRVFNKFSRGHRGVSNAQTGSGLGLAISSQIVGHMNGKLDLVRGNGEGACFRVTLNLVPSPEISD
ncbi:ATP-binding protein [Maritalea porphyrae]|uniref:ATP-binding protein n=1 Tax=Maritalea porphyrae TaxID=880732 RepID=UPI0022AE84B5|nr:ATP-binding protein [Maritalea porphyrae]MCZ4273558.1 ATP-binding protein [Maritalea porphyrae]